MASFSFDIYQSLLHVCCLCWENPSNYVDADGQRWNSCISCEFLEHPYTFTFPC